jgi:hypothetical protein
MAAVSATAIAMGRARFIGLILRQEGRQGQAGPGKGREAFPALSTLPSYPTLPARISS